MSRVLRNQFFSGRVDEIALDLVGVIAKFEPVFAEDVVVEVLILFKLLDLSELFDLIGSELSFRNNSDCLVGSWVAFDLAKKDNRLLLGIVIELLFEEKETQIDLF